jgi:hypothetical protein
VVMGTEITDTQYDPMIINGVWDPSGKLIFLDSHFAK